METTPRKDEQEQALELLKLDYQVSRSLIDKFDGHLFLVRSWAVTTTGAVVALALTVNQPRVLFVGLMPPAFFALLELIYQCWVDDAISYSYYIEAQIQQVALERRPIDKNYQFGVRGRLHPPKFRRMAWRFLHRHELLTMYVGLLLVPIVAALLYPR